MTSAAKRLTAFAFALVFVLAAFAACVPGGEKGDVLTLMGKKSDMEKSYMKRIFDLYEEKTGNRLEVIEIEDAEYEAEAEKRFKDGRGPDIFMHFNNADLGRFDVSENFMYLNGESWVGELTDSARAYCLDGDGNLLGLPFWESSVSGCYYNKTLLDSLGLKPASTQAEFDTLCRALADIGKTPICWAGNGCSWMYQFALDPVFADDPTLLAKLNSGEISYADIPEVKAMTEWISNAAELGWFGDDYLKIGWSEISDVIGSGDAVMTFIWDTWFYTDFAAGKYTVDDFALMPVFMNTVDGGTYEGGNLNMMMVNKNGGHIKTALEFLEFCATAENYNAAFDGISTVSCFVGQTTNIQSHMVTNASASIEAKERVSTAASKIMGYSADDVCAAFDSLFRKKIDVDGCVKLLDENRLRAAGK